jgi:hypothetical protein
LPWSPQFIAAYQAALDQHIEIGSARVKPGSMRALAISYYGSTAFLSMRTSTQRARRNVIDRFCRGSGKDGRSVGDKSAATLQREHIIKMMAARADTPESANSLRKARPEAARGRGPTYVPTIRLAT